MTLHIRIENTIRHRARQLNQQDSTHCLILSLPVKNNPDMVDEVEVVEHLGKSGHCILKWETTFLTMTDEPEKPTRDYRNANYKDMKDDLQKVDWDKEFETCNTDQAWSKLKRYTA